MTSAGCPVNNGCTKRKLKFSCICGQHAAAVEQLQLSQVRCSSCQSRTDISQQQIIRRNSSTISVIGVRFVRKQS